MFFTHAYVMYPKLVKDTMCVWVNTIPSLLRTDDIHPKICKCFYLVHLATCKQPTNIDYTYAI